MRAASVCAETFEQIIKESFVEKTKLPLHAVNERHFAVPDVQVLDVAELVLFERVPRRDFLSLILPSVEYRFVGDSIYFFQLHIQNVRLRDDVPV